ncbi:hypothetical protein GCM10022284_74460 [Streptomyces hundungensis]
MTGAHRRTIRAVYAYPSHESRRSSTAADAPPPGICEGTWTEETAEGTENSEERRDHRKTYLYTPRRQVAVAVTRRGPHVHSKVGAAYRTGAESHRPPPPSTMLKMEPVEAL